MVMTDLDEQFVMPRYTHGSRSVLSGASALI
jgi:hypothetical protein